MVPIIAQATEVILMTVAQKVAIARLVLLSILEVVYSDIRISDVTHLLSFVFLIILVVLEKWAQFISSFLSNSV